MSRFRKFVRLASAAAMAAMVVAAPVGGPIIAGAASSVPSVSTTATPTTAVSSATSSATTSASATSKATTLVTATPSLKPSATASTTQVMANAAPTSASASATVSAAPKVAAQTTTASLTPSSTPSAASTKVATTSPAATSTPTVIYPNYTVKCTRNGSTYTVSYDPLFTYDPGVNAELVLGSAHAGTHRIPSDITLTDTATGFATNTVTFDVSRFAGTEAATTGLVYFHSYWLDANPVSISVMPPEMGVNLTDSKQCVDTAPPAPTVVTPVAPTVTPVAGALDTVVLNTQPTGIVLVDAGVWTKQADGSYVRIVTYGPADATYTLPAGNDGTFKLVDTDTAPPSAGTSNGASNSNRGFGNGNGAGNGNPNGNHGVGNGNGRGNTRAASALPGDKLGLLSYGLIRPVVPKGANGSTGPLPGAIVPGVAAPTLSATTPSAGAIPKVEIATVSTAPKQDVIAQLVAFFSQHWLAIAVSAAVVGGAVASTVIYRRHYFVR